MASGGCACLKIACCCLIVITNIFVVLIGLLTLFLGILFAWGFSLLSGVLKDTLNSAVSSLTDVLKDSFGMELDLFSLLEQINTVTGTMGIIFVILGVVVIALGIVGCCGACCTVKPCLIIYAVGMGILLLIQLALVTIWFTNADLLKNNVKSVMETGVRDFDGLTSTSVTTLLQNVIQIFVGCCGVNNGTDYYTMAEKWNRTYTYTVRNYTASFNLTYPISCCKFDTATFKPIDEYCMYNNTVPETNNYQIGCFDQIFTFIDSMFQLNILFYVMLGIIGFQLLLIAGAIIIMLADRKKNKVAAK